MLGMTARVGGLGGNVGESCGFATTFPNTPPLRKRRCHSERSEETQSNRNWLFRAKRGN